MNASETVRAELAELNASDPDPVATTRWLQRKVLRQAAALDTLNRRVVTQRFALRTLAELGRSLSPSEWAQARDRIGNEALRERIDTAQ